MTEDFTLNNRAMQAWLAGLTAAEIAVVVLTPPAIWLCVAGMALLVIASTANSIRTGRWYSGGAGSTLNWFEGWAAASAIVSFLVPIAAIMLRWVAG